MVIGRAFRGSRSDPRVGSGCFQNLAGRVGSGRVGSGRVRKSHGPSQVGSGGVGNITSRVGSGHPDPARPASSDPTHKKPCS